MFQIHHKAVMYPDVMIFREKLFQLAEPGAEQNVTAILLMDVHIVVLASAP
jgi:hypothetical protein